VGKQGIAKWGSLEEAMSNTVPIERCPHCNSVICSCGNCHALTNGGYGKEYCASECGYDDDIADTYNQKLRENEDFESLIYRSSD